MSFKPFKIYLAKKRLAHAKKKVTSHPIKNCKFFFSFFGPKIFRNFNEYEIYKKKSKYNVFLKKNIVRQNFILIIAVQVK